MLNLTLHHIDEFRIKLLSAILTGDLSGKTGLVAMKAQHELCALRHMIAHGGESAICPDPDYVAGALAVQAMIQLERTIEKV